MLTPSSHTRSACKHQTMVVEHSSAGFPACIGLYAFRATENTDMGVGL